MSVYAVFGNPIKHSKSSEIYSLFAKSAGISGIYDLKLASEKDFNDMLHDFFKKGGLGANITVPFKKKAFYICKNLTDRAIMSKTVNTIKKQDDNILLGDNTDGIGLINDLKRLKWINSDNKISSYFSDGEFVYSHSDILLIGAGGAAQGIIPVLLNIKNCYINIVNRTFFNAQKLVRYYHSIGRQNISCIDLDKLSCFYKRKKYNLIINASSSSMENDVPNIPSSLITNSTKCYDLFYQKEDTAFIKWCKKNGSDYCSDGLGMLVEQAAYSFYLWHNIFPIVGPVFHNLKLNMTHSNK